MKDLSATSPLLLGGLGVTFVVVLWAAMRPQRASVPASRLRVVVWSLVITSGVVLTVHMVGWVPTDIPQWFYLLGVLPFIGLAVLLTGGRKLGVVGCTMATLSILLGSATATTIANQHYGYWPTIGSFFGSDHVDPMMQPDVAIALAENPPLLESMPASLGGSTVKSASQGRLVDISIPGAVSHFSARRTRVWLPPGWRSDPMHPRPVIELVGGTPSWPSDWTRASSLDVIADHYATTHRGEAPILVMVDANGAAFGDTECVDGPKGNAETYLSVDVPNFIETHLGGSAQPSAWGIIGYSEGGTCAVILALRHPEQFSAFADLAGDLGPNLGSHKETVRSLFRGSESSWAAHDPTSLMNENRYEATSGWFASGTGDSHARHESRLLTRSARQAGLNVSEHSYAGSHDFRFVKNALTDALPWMSDRLFIAS